MARCHVAFEEVERLAPAADRTEVELGPPPPPAWRGRAGLQERRRIRPGTVAAAVLLLVGGWAAWPSTVASEEDAERRSPDHDEAPADVRAPMVGTGVVTVQARDVVAAPWRGVFEHHPDVRGAVSVPRVHVVALGGDAGTSALFVVDATRRAFGDPERAWRDDGEHVRVLGSEAGTGVRTLQWDDDGYGVSLTTAGLTLADQQRLADALVLPDGPALVHGRAPTLDRAATGALGLEVTGARSGPGEPLGSPLIGQSGGASIDGLVHRSDGGTVLVSVVEDQLASAAWVRRALAPHADLPVDAIDGVTSAALVAHPGAAVADRRVRGWNRLLLDHPAGVTVEVSSDVLGVDDLVAVARDLDLDRLARTVAPRR